MDINTTTSGIIAALTAPLLMSIGFLIWDIQWKKAGGSAFALNLYKCNLASVGFIIMCLALSFHTTTTTTTTTADPSSQPTTFSFQNVGYLILSSTLGIMIGDLFWLEALKCLGATRVLVVDTAKPFAAAGLGWLFLGEDISHAAIYGGMVMTVVGVLVVSLENDDDDGENDVEGGEPQRSVDEEGGDDDDDERGETVTGRIDEEEPPSHQSPERHNNDKDKVMNIDTTGPSLRSKTMEFRRGYLLAVSNVFIDAYGSLLTKQYGVGMTTWAINLIRFGAAGVTMSILSIIMRIYHRCRQPQKRELSTTTTTTTVTTVDSSSYSYPKESRRHQWYEMPDMSIKAWVKVSIGVGFVTFLCPALSAYALFRITLALAITLGSVTPLYALVLEWPMKGKMPTIRSFVGVVLAVSGVVVLCLFTSAE